MDKSIIVKLLAGFVIFQNGQLSFVDNSGQTKAVNIDVINNYENLDILYQMGYLATDPQTGEAFVTEKITLNSHTGIAETTEQSNSDFLKKLIDSGIKIEKNHNQVV